MRKLILSVATVASLSFVLAGMTTSHAAQFDNGDVFRAGFTTVNAPPNIAATAALLGPAQDRTVNANTFGEFSLGSSLAVNLDGTSINGFCLVAQQFCGTLNSPISPGIFVLILADNAVPGGNWEPIINVTSSFLSASKIYFDENTIILDLSGLTFLAHPTITQLAQVTFGEPTTNPVPIPGALPLFASGVAGLGYLAVRRRRKQAAA